MDRKQTQPAGLHPDFVVFTAPLAVKHDGADGERPTLVATASSTAIDLEADRFTKSALEQMRDGFKGRVIFMNHQYRVPVDVFGVVEEASLIKREGRLDLDLVIRVETGNPLAVQTYDYIVNGTRLGVSVGVIVTDAEKTEDEDKFGKRIVDISGVIPLEASIVGIPANQTAWTQEAVKSLFARGAIEFDEDEIAARPWLTTVATVDKPKPSRSNEKEDTMSKEAADSSMDNTDIDTKPDKDADDDSADDDHADADNKDADSDKDADSTKDADDDSTKDADDDSTKDADDDSTKDADEPEDKDDDDDSDEKDSSESDETKDQEGEDEEGGGEDAHDANDGDGDHKDADADKDDDSTKDAFMDDVAADEAADLLIDKMYTGFRVALNNLIGIVLNTDMNAGQRAEEGAEVIASWKGFIEASWDETIDHLSDEKSVKSHEEFNVAARLHDLAGKDAAVKCDVAEVNEFSALAEEVNLMAETIAEENTQLREEVVQKAQALEYAAEIIEAVMDLPLPTVTAEAGQVARNLAERFPNLDTRVVERFVRFAPKRRHVAEKE